MKTTEKIYKFSENQCFVNVPVYQQNVVYFFISWNTAFIENVKNDFQNATNTTNSLPKTITESILRINVHQNQ